MSQEVTSLVIQIDSNGVVTGSKRLDDFTRSGEKAEKATDKLVGTLKELAVAYLSIEGAAKALEKLYDVGKEFQTLEAQIRTATGTTKEAHEAFVALQELAVQTPFSLREVTNAFTNLVNKGLDPSQAALKSYANTATALNISLDEVTNAVIVASSGMYRGLIALGIKAKETQDGIVLTYHGASTKIRKDAADIEAYVQSLGNTHFVSAMTERAATLEGATNRLKKSWDDLFVTINEQGAADLIKRSIEAATDALENFTSMIASGQLKGYVDALLFKFESLTDGIAIGFYALTQVIDDAFKYWSSDGADTANAIKHAFTQMPENIRAAFQVLGATLSAFLTAEEMVAKAFINIWIDSFRLYVDLAIAAGKAAAVALVNPLKASDVFTTGSSAAWKKFTSSTKEEAGRVAMAIAGIGAAWEDSVTDSMNERDAALNSFKLQIDRANALRDTYEKLKKAREESTAKKDPLSGFKPASGNTHINSPQDIAAYEQLVKELQLEETSIAESYRRRLDLIRNNTEQGSALRLELEKELEAKVTAEYETAFQTRKDKVLKLQQALSDAIASGHMEDADALATALLDEEARIRESYQNRRDQILNDTSTTEEQKLALLAKLERKYTKQQQDFELARQKDTLAKTSDFFGNIAAMASAFGAKGAKIAKAAAIVQATIKTYESATSAYAALAGIPYVGPVLGAAAAGAAIAAGMANIAAIKAQNYSGAYDDGGMIPAGQFGIAGENGPELVRGPAVVTSRRATADRGKDGASPNNVTLNVINMAGAETQTTQTDGPDGKVIQLIIAKTKADIANAMDIGGDPISKVFERRYQLRRGAA